MDMYTQTRIMIFFMTVKIVIILFSLILSEFTRSEYSSAYNFSYSYDPK